MLLIYPPVAKIGEPPAGIARLAGALRSVSLPHAVLDANLEGQLWLMHQAKTNNDAWSRRAVHKLQPNLELLRDRSAYVLSAFDRYSRAVRDVQRTLDRACAGSSETVTLSDHAHAELSPLRSSDLLVSAAQPEKSIFYPWFSRKLVDLLGRKSCSTVGLSLNYLSQAVTGFAMLGFIRREFPGVKIILGGGLVTSWMTRPGWSDPFTGLVDHLIAGPGEQPLLRLMGVTSADCDGTVPDYGSFLSREYLAPGFILPYSASSGCYWNKCSFCPEPAENNVYKPVSPRAAVSAVRDLAAGTGAVLVHFLDNALSSALMQEIIREPPGPPWYGFARFEKPLLDLDHCMALKRSGCRMLKLGLESGDQAVLDATNKGIILDEVVRTLKNLKQAGIAAYVYLLFGTPDENIDSARMTLRFIGEHADAVTFLNLAIFNMPICGNEMSRYETEQFSEADLSLYTGFKHPLGWDRRNVRQFLEREFKKNPAIAEILRRDPPVFTSNHAALFV